MQPYLIEFFTLAVVHLLAVASPGPDLAIVIKHSVRYGRRVAIYTSLGIGVAILLHVFYSLIGIGLIIQQTPFLFNLLSYLAAAYLLFIGFKSLTNKSTNDAATIETNSVNQVISDKKAFSLGFLTNGINPKATLFFLSVFAVVVSADTPNTIKGLYGIYLAFATGAWFCVMSLILSHEAVRQKMLAYGGIFDKVMGAILILLAIKLLIPV